MCHWVFSTCNNGHSMVAFRTCPAARILSPNRICEPLDPNEHQRYAKTFCASDMYCGLSRYENERDIQTQWLHYHERDRNTTMREMNRHKRLLADAKAGVEKHKNCQADRLAHRDHLWPRRRLDDPTKKGNYPTTDDWACE